jgi:tetratricopeptide (TPR) repeat protein
MKTSDDVSKAKKNSFAKTGVAATSESPRVKPGDMTATPKRPTAKANTTASRIAEFERRRREAEADPQYQSQQLVFSAMDAPSASERKKLLQQALQLDEENPDALFMMTDVKALRGETRVLELKRILAIAKNRLGAKAFDKLVPHFWGFNETRPLMRIKENLAYTLMQGGQLNEAIAEYTDMLRLNENDNQGMRYLLLPCLLAANEIKRAGALLKKYADDVGYSVVFAWGAVLERVLAGHPLGASKALVQARAQNGHVEAYLKGHRKLPVRRPDFYSPGTKEEAICFAPDLMRAWGAHAGAMEWLRASGDGS